jgi:hypothetical protein
MSPKLNQVISLDVEVGRGSNHGPAKLGKVKRTSVILQRIRTGSDEEWDVHCSIAAYKMRKLRRSKSLSATQVCPRWPFIEHQDLW